MGHGPLMRDAQGGGIPPPFTWPPFTAECRPWARWWWLGSAVDKENLTRLLEEYRRAGLGGVEICPIYGARGYEERFIEFLSPRWMEMLAHTLQEAQRLGLGVDLTTGTGWPFGGPWVPEEDASSGVLLERYALEGGEEQEVALPQGRCLSLMAFAEDGRRVDLTREAKGGRLRWRAPPGRWRLYAVVQRGPVQRVKRAAPGGEGFVVDPYSVQALGRYLKRFEEAFAPYRGPRPRAHFHDSFEYFGAQWTKDFFDEFAARRGYDLREHLPAFLGEGPEEMVARIRSDYRETISDLHLDYIRHWTDWCHRQGSLSRNQAHGAPAHLLDLYAAADIPETETFGPVEERQIPMHQFASSAAHLKGQPLVSAEAFTWLGEHFQVSLAQVKEAADHLFLAGVNHLILHGIPYSPAEVPWPGWQFYAAVNFGPQGGLWRDLPAFADYVARCQSILQSGKPANDVLLYFPVHDLWHGTGDLLLPFTMHNLERWLYPQPFYALAWGMWERGYPFDFVSDRFLAQALGRKGEIVLGGNAYRAVLVPRCRLMPEATLQRLMELAQAGAFVLFHKSLPQDVPGWGNLEGRRARFAALLGQLRWEDDGQGLRKAVWGQGAFWVGDEWEALLRRAGVPREPAVDLGLRFVRRAHAQGYHYFLVNRGERPVEGWVELGRPARAAVLLDPRREARAGLAALRRKRDGSTLVYLQLQPGESCILRTFTDTSVEGPPWAYFQPDGAPFPLKGTWQVEFIEGGPTLPPPFETQELVSWTLLGDEEARRFHGTARYTLYFKAPTPQAEEWLLDLGRVCESARVWLNGSAVATLWCRPFQTLVGQWLQPGLNRLEVEVTNLAANRIADLDRRGVRWKSFYDINIVNRQYRPLDASTWPPFDSGLLGPVSLQALQRVNP